MFLKNKQNKISNSIRIRLFVEGKYGKGCLLEISESQVHYLKNVMRLDAGKQITVFNGLDGEWLATIVNYERKGCGTIKLLALSKPYEVSPNCWLLFPPLRSLRTDYLIEKSTEIGVSKLIPVKTSYSQISRFNVRRHRSNAIEASEQCGRLDIPLIEPLLSLEDVLSMWPESRILFFCDETGGEPILKASYGCAKSESGFGVLVGPEGGFTISERIKLKKQPFVRVVSLGSFKLRTETAAIAALRAIFASKDYNNS